VEQFKNFKKCRDTMFKSGTLEGSRLCCNAFYDCSESCVLENSAFGHLRK
jgi:hypothetical protein